MLWLTPLRIQDVCAHLHVNVDLETSASPNNKEPSPKSGTSAPLASPTRSDPTRSPRLQSSFGEARWDQIVAQSSWQCSGSPTIPSLDLVYGLWNTCASDGEESLTALHLESSLDGDIFGAGKRPIQREIERDGCIRLVFVEE